MSKDVVLLDLEDGSKWWETRLLVLCAAAQRFGQVRAIAFVAVDHTVARTFQGWARPDQLLAVLLERRPELQKAAEIAAVTARRWSLAYPASSTPLTAAKEAAEAVAFYENHAREQLVATARAAAQLELAKAAPPDSALQVETTEPAASHDTPESGLEGEAQSAARAAVNNLQAAGRLPVAQDNTNPLPHPAADQLQQRIDFDPEDGAALNEVFLLAALEPFEAPVPPVISLARLQDLFGAVLRDISLDESTDDDAWLETALRNEDDYLAVTRGKIFLDLVSRAQILTRILASMAERAR